MHLFSLRSVPFGLVEILAHAKARKPTPVGHFFTLPLGYTLLAGRCPSKLTAIKEILQLLRGEALLQQSVHILWGIAKGPGNGL